MRLWTLHPKHLDPAGLVALWREGLLAQAVLLGKTRGYTHHPQLARFLSCSNPKSAIACYLSAIHQEALARGYRFNASKIQNAEWHRKVPATHGQLLFEWAHFGEKLLRRNRKWYETHHLNHPPIPHPLFRITPGPIQSWERSSRTEPANRVKKMLSKEAQYS
jgi:hypothetical protein